GLRHPPWYNTRMSAQDVDGLNSGYARALLDEYLENPEAVPTEWRALFESGHSQLVASHAGIARLIERLQQNGNGHGGTTVAAEPAPAGVTEPDAQLLGAVAA